VDLQKVGIDSPIKVVLKEGVDAGMLEDEVLEGITDIRYIKYPTLIKGHVREDVNTYGSRSAPWPLHRGGHMAL
jgi:hypothetical protein